MTTWTGYSFLPMLANNKTAIATDVETFFATMWTSWKIVI